MAYTGPGDLKTYRVWGGLRAYSAAYAAPGNNPCLDLYVSNVLVGTINILATGALDTARAAALIGGGTGRIGKLYDQSGNANHFIQATDAKRPILTLNATGLGSGQPAFTFVTGSELLVTTNNIPVLAGGSSWTMTAFARRTTNNGVADLLSTADASINTLWLGFGATAVIEFAAPTATTFTETDNVWHSISGTMDGAALNSAIGLDGIQHGVNPGTSEPDGANKLSSNNFGSSMGDVTELGYAESLFVTTDVSALNTNDQYWFAPIPTLSSQAGFRAGSASIRRVMRVIGT